MKNMGTVNNPYNDDKVISACSIFGAMDTSGRRFSGEGVVRAIANMHNRSNGLGGGFAVYGIYPDYAEQYALHVMYLGQKARGEAEEYLRRYFTVVHEEEIPTRPAAGVGHAPVLRRYFVEVGNHNGFASDDDYVVGHVININAGIESAFVFSSGNNMGVFKGVGYPEDIAAFYCLDSYKGYLWTAHGRFPTNTPGWWGGAHPFGILDWTVVHNGEISSYGINRRYLEAFGYNCTMQTDTEVIAYALDLLVRRHGLPMKVVSRILAPPFWDDIERCGEKEREGLRALRQVYGSLLLNGPFTIIIAHRGEMVGLTDRVRLRPLVVGENGPMVYLSSEESAIRLICPELEKAWTPMGGEPVVARLKQPERVSVPVRVGRA